MTKREECIEAMKQAIADNIDGWVPERARYPAVAAFDACIKALMELGEAMLSDGGWMTGEHSISERKERARCVWQAMLATLQTPQ